MKHAAVPFFVAAALSAAGIAHAQDGNAPAGAAKPAPSAHAKKDDAKKDDAKKDDAVKSDAKKDDAVKSDAKKSDAGADTSGGDDEDTEAGSAEAPPPVTNDEPREPPPPPPRASAQEPHPYLAEPAPVRPVRKVDVGPDFGVGYRPAQGGDASYAAGFAWGIHARIEAADWLGLRLYFTTTHHAVSVPTGALGLAGTTVDQPDLSVTLLGARLEPTWAFTPHFRAFAGLGAGWARVIASPATSTGTLSIQSGERSGVGLEFSGALGAIVDIVPDWVEGTLSVSGAAVTNQSGSVFEDSQAFDQNGAMVTLGELPHFAASLSAMGGVGLVL